MFIQLSPEVMHSYDFVGLVREACNILSSEGIPNYVHQTDENNCWVELFDPAMDATPELDFVNSGINFKLITP